MLDKVSQLGDALPKRNRDIVLPFAEADVQRIKLLIWNDTAILRELDVQCK